MNSESTGFGNDCPLEVYPAKRDIWFVGASWLIIVSICCVLLIITDDVPLIIAGTSLLLIGIAIDQSNSRNTCYVLQDDHLLIRMGWFRHRRLFSDIVEVRPMRPLIKYKLSAYALSGDSLFVRHRRAGSSLFISPEDKEAFMRDLASRSPGLIYQGVGSSASTRQTPAQPNTIAEPLLILGRNPGQC